MKVGIFESEYYLFKWNIVQSGRFAPQKNNSLHGYLISGIFACSSECNIYTLKVYSHIFYTQYTDQSTDTHWIFFIVYCITHNQNNCTVWLNLLLSATFILVNFVSDYVTLIFYCIGMETPRKRRKLSLMFQSNLYHFNGRVFLIKNGKLQFCLLNWEMEPQVEWVCLGEVGGTMEAEIVFITTCICISWCIH